MHTTFKEVGEKAVGFANKMVTAIADKDGQLDLLALAIAIKKIERFINDQDPHTVQTAIEHEKVLKAMKEAGQDADPSKWF